MSRSGMAIPILALAATAASPAAAEGQRADLLADRTPASAAEFVKLFSEICVGLLPRYQDRDRALAAVGFAEPDALGTRVHDRRALMIRVEPNEAAAPPDGPGCMLIGEDVALDDAAPLLTARLTETVGEVESMSVEAVGLPHRIWIWPVEEGRAEVVASTDDAGRLVIGLGVRLQGDRP